MIFNSTTPPRRISAKITDRELELARAYIKGALHYHRNVNPRMEFSVRIAFGGGNRDWHNTPLQCIYDFYVCRNVKDPENRAAKDVGWLLKQILAEDSHAFAIVGKDTGNIYKMC